MSHAIRLLTVAGLLFLTAMAALHGQGRGARGAATLPASPVVTPVPEFKTVTGPGEPFPGLQRLPAKEDLKDHKYILKEYFVSGTAAGQPYTTRILVRRPSDARKFSGIVVAEPMHPSGNSWMFHFAHSYIMSQGHISLEIVTANVAQIAQSNPERYKELRYAPGQANEILAQVGALVKANPKNGPLEGLPLRRVTLMGTSASAGTVMGYLPAHAAYRLEGMKPIYDGFLPTSQGGNTPLPQVDVPVILMPTMTEVNSAAASGNRYRRPDGDKPGDQFRIYEVAGMAHNDSRVNPTYDPDPCRLPVSRFPLGALMSVGLDHLIQWTDKGKVPPHAEYIAVDNDAANDGSLLALDANGNAKGGIRTSYVDVPLFKYGVPNEGSPTPVPNASAMVLGRGANGAQFFCGIAGYQQALSKEQLQSLYRDKRDYQSKVERRLEELTKAGWFLPMFRQLVLDDAKAAKF